jgi:hypothetical protein
MSSLLEKIKISITPLFVCFLHFTYLKIRKKSSFLFFTIITLLLILNIRMLRGNAHKAMTIFSKIIAIILSIKFFAQCPSFRDNV